MPRDPNEMFYLIALTQKVAVIEMLIKEGIVTPEVMVLLMAEVIQPVEVYLQKNIYLFQIVKDIDLIPIRDKMTAVAFGNNHHQCSKAILKLILLLAKLMGPAQILSSQLRKRIYSKNHGELWV